MLNIFQLNDSKELSEDYNQQISLINMFNDEQNCEFRYT